MKRGGEHLKTPICCLKDQDRLSLINVGIPLFLGASVILQITIWRGLSRTLGPFFIAITLSPHH